MICCAGTCSWLNEVMPCLCSYGSYCHRIVVLLVDGLHIVVPHFLILCLSCRGNDPYGAIGDGTRFNTYQLPTVSGGGLKFSDFSFGFSHHCGLLYPSGQMNCWGEGTAGQLGDGLTADRWIPGPLGGGHAGTSWISFQCASDYTAGIDVAGKIYTWGYEWFGNLAKSITPGTIVPLPVIAAVCPGCSRRQDHLCAHYEQHDVLLWRWRVGTDRKRRKLHCADTSHPWIDRLALGSTGMARHHSFGRLPSNKCEPTFGRRYVRRTAD
jgi:hypothetical protein